MDLLKKKKLITGLKVLFGVIIVILLILGIKGFMGNFSIRILEKGLHGMSYGSLAFLVILGLIAFSPMCLYDYFIKKKLNFDIKNRKIFKYGFIINAITIVAGVGDAAGISLRTYFYKEEKVDKKTLLTEITKVSLLNPSGLSILSILYLIFYVRPNNFFTIGNLCAFIIALYIPGIIIYSYYKNKKNNAFEEGKYLFSIVFSSFLDWALSIGLFFAITTVLHTHLSFIALFPIFVISMLLGMVSMLPGAIGAFDLTMIVGLSTAGIPKEIALFAVFLYRLTYYLIPLLISLILFLHEFYIRSSKNTREIFSSVYTGVGFIALRVLVLLSGVSLLLSNAIPSLVYKIKELRFLSLNTEMHFSKTLVIIVGFLLIVMGFLIKTKAKSIYYLTIIFLIVGTILTVLKSFNLIAVVYLLIVFVCVILSRKAFTRKSFKISVEDMIVCIALLVILWGVYLIGVYLNYPYKLYKLPFIFKSLNKDYRALIGTSSLGLLISIVSLVVMHFIGKYKNKMPDMTLDKVEDKVKETLEKYNGTSLTHLVYLRDKYVFVSEKYEGFIQYAKMSNKVFVLGNPVGNMDTMREFIEEFYDFVDLYGYTPIFFEVSSEMLGILHEFGYGYMKTGEAAIVDLSKFTIAGQKMQKVRTCCNKITKSGYTYEVVEKVDERTLDKMQDISDLWLNGRNEMGYSMGFFDRAYIKTGPVLLVRNEEGELKAFLTLMQTYGENKKLCSDLMRHTNDNPRGVMDYTFVKAMEWAKENGYEEFDMGVAPLSNVGTSKYSFLTEKIAYQMYLFGERVYSFEGLKKYKAKYAHNWEPKFLAYKNKLELPLTTLQANLIVEKAEKRREEMK
ncbi:MAG: bifunctional lysylphosphatidylglycerol flippase/synthetase MprF [Clostridium sp.]|uniref:bifunctional lysylphosphatidylglycerol flippase/synthetase MprF n=1 Tax=Clostridium sp. TaxID=1506 RepID=UPI003F39E301